MFWGRGGQNVAAKIRNAKPKAKQNSLAKAAKINYVSICIFLEVSIPRELLKQQKNGKSFCSSLNHWPSQPEIICTNKNKMGRTSGKKHSGSVFCITALRELSQESDCPPATGAHKRDAAQGKNPMPGGQAIPAIHFQTTSCRRLHPDPKPIPKHNQETCAEDDLL